LILRFITAKTSCTRPPLQCDYRNRGLVEASFYLGGEKSIVQCGEVTATPPALLRGRAKVALSRSTSQRGTGLLQGDWRCMVFFFWCNWHGCQAALVLGVPHRTVKAQLARARAKLARRAHRKPIRGWSRTVSPGKAVQRKDPRSGISS
jgi:hypothetical protein